MAKTTFDNTYNGVYSEPEYDSELDRKKYQLMREADEVLEVR